MFRVRTTNLLKSECSRHLIHLPICTTHTRSEDNKGQHELTAGKLHIKPEPPDPNLCCMSGCANCIWIKYALDLEEYLKDGKPLHKRIEDEMKIIEDASLKAFIKMQLDEKEK